MLSSYADPCCFSCKAGWSADFLALHFPLSFRNDTLRKHRRKVLLEREKSMLPAMVVFVEAKKNIARSQALFSEADALYQSKALQFRELKKRLDSIYPRYSHFKAIREQGITLSDADDVEYRRLRKQVKRLREDEHTFNTNELRPAYEAVLTLRREVARWFGVYATGEDTGPGAAKEKRQFIMRCPADDCRGFLSQHYVCGVCDKKTCADCLELLPGGPDAQHTCKPESVESAKAIKKETRPCPKCGARIFKLEGCNQMFCTVEGCGTAFDWNSGQIATGRIHNPHYYEWLRRNNGGTAPREIVDIPCGGIPAAWAFTRWVIRYPHLRTDEKNLLLDIHRNMTEFESRLRDYPAVRPALANKEINVAYLMNDMTEPAWERQLELNEAKFNRKREIGQILHTLVTAGAEMLQGVIDRIEPDGHVHGWGTTAATWIRETALPTLESLRAYTNEAYKDLGKAHHMAVPQINERWAWLGIRALYRGAKVEDAASVPPALVDDNGAIVNEVV